MHLVLLFLLPCTSVGAACYFSCTTHERILRKEKTVRKSDWIKHPSHSVRVLNNILTGTEQDLNSISAFLVKEPKRGFFGPGIETALLQDTCIEKKARG